jgi:hypothetical protein
MHAKRRASLRQHITTCFRTIPSEKCGKFDFSSLIFLQQDHPNVMIKKRPCKKSKGFQEDMSEKSDTVVRWGKSGYNIQVKDLPNHDVNSRRSGQPNLFSRSRTDKKKLNQMVAGTDRTFQKARYKQIGTERPVHTDRFDS